MMSHEIDKLAAALAKAQGAMESAKKSSDNPFFHSRYSDLAEVWATWRAAGPPNGLAVVQPVLTRADGSMYLRTVIMHSSGQWYASEYPIRLIPPLSKEGKPMPVTPQVVGSELSYCRRYAFMACVGIAASDDDGEAASGRATQPVAPPPPKTALKSVPKADAPPAEDRLAGWRKRLHEVVSANDRSAFDELVSEIRAKGTAAEHKALRADKEEAEKLLDLQNGGAK
jgi:hypothetical protein